MEVYVYQAALICKPCGDAVRADRQSAAYRGTPFLPANPDDESSYDSDYYPKGPYPDGGGEADSPQHCDHCHVFLENPLTSDGDDYVRERLESGDGDSEVLATWGDFYDYLRAE